MTNWQRIAIGLFGLVGVIFGSAMYFVNAENTFLTAVLVRVGALLCVIWLAWPQLEAVKTRIPGFVLLALLLMLIVVAVRPNLFRVIAGVLAVGLALSGLLKWIGILTSEQNKS